MKKKKLQKNYKIILKTSNNYIRISPGYDKITDLFSSQQAFEKNQSFFTRLKKKFKRKEKLEKPTIPDNVERFDVDYKVGLNAEQINKRIAQNLTNNTKVKSSRSYASIFFKNIFTFFNMMWLIIAVALLSVGSYKNMLFVFVVIANTAIAIIQEIRAKITVEKLSIETTPQVKTIREGKVIDIASEKLVLDDIIVLTSGNHIPADCTIVDGKVEVNEALLTGESNSIEKKLNDKLLSGSFIVSGECRAKVEKIGKDNYIYQMAKKAKEFKAPQSNLFKDLNSLIKYIGIALVPIGILTFLKEYTVAGSTLAEQISRTSGALTSMIPAGMFLLTTIALAVGVVKLSRKKTLVKDPYSIEMLARANVLCLDKTGTITDGTMNVVDVMNFSKKKKSSIQKIMSSILNAQKTLNATSNALIKEFGRSEEFRELNTIEFSSSRKYSVTQLSNNKIYFLGAVTRIGCALSPQHLDYIKSQQEKGLRVIALSELENAEFSKNITGENSTLIALIVIEEKIREDAIETIAWFKDNGVDVKIISGDDPQTVAMLAQRVGVRNSDKYVSLENFSLKEVEQMADDFTVFGRVTPDQKYAIVKALKNKGKVVAMTGDGVNDTLALKEADCSIAMADGSEVARSISNIVLMNSTFSSLPSIVKEGRQVVNNVQNSSSLFLMKTFFAILLTVITLFVQLPYPFEPSMMLLFEFFVIGAPSFLLTFEPNNKQIKGNFIPQVLKKSLPKSLLMLFNIAVLMVLNYSFTAIAMSAEEYTTLCVLTLTYTGVLNLLTICIPFTLVKAIVLAFSVVGSTVAIAVMPKLFSITANTPIVFIVFFSIIAFSALVILIAKLNRRRIEKFRHKVIDLLQKQ